MGAPWWGFQVRVERAGPESPPPLIYSMQVGFLWEGRFLKPFGGWERNWLGKMSEYQDAGLRIKDFSHKARSCSLLPLPPGAWSVRRGL